MKSSSPKSRSSILEYNRLKKVIDNLEKMQKSSEGQSEIRNLNSVSLKLLSNQLSQAYQEKSCPKKPFKKPKNFQKPVALESLEFASQVLEDKDPSDKKFLTESMMQSQPIYAVLNKKKRQFGPQGSQSPDYQITPYPMIRNALSSRAVNKRLDAILYNNVYKNSLRSKRFQIIKHFEEVAQEPRLFNFKSERTSPTILKNFKESEKMQISKEFRNLVSQEELEIDLIKLKLSKSIFRDAFV